MDPHSLRQLLEQVRSGTVAIDAALERMRHMPFEDLGFAKVDHHRALRQGAPEVIFGLGKTPDQVSAIAASLAALSPNLLITRTDAETAARIARELPGAEYFPASRAIRLWRDRTMRSPGTIVVVCAGTSDLPVAEEA